jgi:beta-phosphoglucomutase-like phosphatase (HAD superfamily)
MGATIDTSGVEVLLCDADGNLFPSEELAFIPSTLVVNRFMDEAGRPERFDPEELRAATTGKNFRTTIADLARAHEIRLAPAVHEMWVDEERRSVTAFLGERLGPDGSALATLRRLAQRFELAAVSSSAATRLDACFAATGLAELFPPEVRFSAEDSLPTPTSKPDPAIYAHAGRVLEVGPEGAVAIEDSVPGVDSALAAGYRTIGNVTYVPDDERQDRTEALLAAGATLVVSSWTELEAVLLAGEAIGTRPDGTSHGAR